MQFPDHVGRHEIDHQIRADGAADDGEDAFGHQGAVLAEQRAERAWRMGLGRVRFVQMRSDVKAYGRNQQAQEERHAPSPALQRFRRQAAVQHRRCQRAAQGGNALAAKLPAHTKATPADTAGLHQHGGGGTDLAAQREALKQTPRQNDQRAKQARRGVRRGHRQTKRSNHHQADGQRHGSLAPVAVGIVADHEAAQRPHHKADAERCHGQQQRTVGALGGEEQLADHEREEAVDGEVIHFQRVADGAGGDQPGLAGSSWLGGSRCGGKSRLQGGVIHRWSPKVGDGLLCRNPWR